MDALKAADWVLAPLRSLAWPVAEPARTWAQMIADLTRIRAFEDDWDSEGSEAPPPALIDSAVSLAHTLEAAGWPSADRVTATFDATLCFEWHPAQGYLELEVENPEEAEARWVAAGADKARLVRLHRIR